MQPKTEQPLTPTGTLMAEDVQNTSPVEQQSGMPPAPSPIHQEPKNRLMGLAMLVATLGLLVGAGGVGFGVILQKKVNILQATLAQNITETKTANTKATEALSTAKSIPDYSKDIGRVEATMNNRFLPLDKAINKDLPEEIKLLKATDERNVAANKELANALNTTATVLRQTKDLAEKNDANNQNIIAILKNQDKVLRRLVQPASSEQGENP